MESRAILKAWGQALAAGLVAGIALAALIAAQTPLCPPEADDCLVDQWGAYAGVRAGLATSLVTVPYFAWRARLAWPVVLGSVAATGLVNAAWHYADRPGHAALLLAAAAAVATATLHRRRAQRVSLTR